jgi:hypothetical protein
MTNPIPPAYLAAGKLTWESDGGTVVWGLAWGGANYTGTNTGTLTTTRRQLQPALPVASALGHQQLVLFPGAFNAPSTNNAADYVVSPGNATFTNNAGETGSVPVELMGFTVR